MPDATGWPDAADPSLDQWLTPVWVAEALIERHFSDLEATDLVLEPSCGAGSFLAAVPRHVPAIGVEIDPKLARLACANTGRPVAIADFRTVALELQPTAVIGNPPFALATVDAFLERAHALLPEGGRVGFVLPAYAFQTAGRVAGYAERWSIAQELLPRNLFPDLSKPLVFALFRKDRKRTLVGFALYREAVDVLSMPKAYRDLLERGLGTSPRGSVWLQVVVRALAKLGGEADLAALYAEIAPRRPTGNPTASSSASRAAATSHGPTGSGAIASMPIAAR